MVKKLYHYQIHQVNLDKNSLNEIEKYLDNKSDLSIIQAAITNNVKDAEMTLRNINIGIKHGQSSYSTHPEEVIASKCDLLLHWITFYNLEISDHKMMTFANSLLKDNNLLSISNDLRAQVHFLVGLTKFISEKISYFEVKNHLKSALIEADDPNIKSVIAHNLAIINFCEI